MSYFRFTVYILLLGGTCFSCVEPIDVTAEINEESSLAGTLIVEANITTANKRQTVIVSRMRQVESDSTVNVEEDVLFNPFTPVRIPNGLEPLFESNASVAVIDNANNRFVFTETDPGMYLSEIPFAAIAGNTYQLVLTTADNTEYVSDWVGTPATSVIDSVYAERITNDFGEDGMAIFVDSSVPPESNGFLRFAFEETYKIIAPNWTPNEFEIIDEGNPGFGIPPVVTTVPRKREERTCFRTDPSTQILLRNTSILSSNRLERNPVRFLSRNNPVISHRYSILVTQYGISQQAFRFYENLNSFSSNESVFSQVQPGPLEGNVVSVNMDVPVIGFFEISTETSRRIYFNYSDFFPNEPLPPYFDPNFNCDRLLSPPLLDPELDGPPSPDGECPQALVPRIKLGLVEFVDVNSDPGICEGPYFVTPTICGDCNVVGSNVVPDFWVDE